MTPPHEHQDQAQGSQDQEDTGFEIMTAVQETVPGPDVLCKGKRDQNKGSQQQEQPAHIGVQVSRLCEIEEVRRAPAG
jgi:hypothetical protein